MKFVRFVLTSFAFLVLTLVSARGEVSRVDTLKKFLASPPSIDNFVFGKRRLKEIAAFPGAPPLDTNSYQYFSAKWQDSDFLLREVGRLEELENPAALTNQLAKAFGKSGSTFWKVIGDNYVYWEDTKGAYASGYVPLQNIPPGEPVLREVSVMREVLLQAVSFGIGNLKPNSVKWNGNSFTAENQDHLPLMGELTVQDDIPKELHYRANGEHGASIVEFDYENTSPTSVLPDKFTYGYLTTNGVKIPIVEFAIVSLEIATSRIPVDGFSSVSLQTKGYTKTIRAVGNNLYWKDPKGKTITISTGGAKSMPQWFAITIVCITAILPLLFLRHKLKNKKP